MKIIDSHLHVGRLSDTVFFSVEMLESGLLKWNVQAGFVMPIMRMQGIDNFEENLKLYEELFAKNICVPTFYVTPNSKWEIDKKFKAIKIHTYAQSWSDENLLNIAKLASKQKLLFLIHTGYDECCSAIRFEKIISEFPETTYILCHGRPIKYVAYLMQKYPNVWVDTAFMPIEDVAELVNKGFEDRILFGSDYPINRWFPQLANEHDWYTDLIDKIKRFFTKDVCEKIFHKNFSKLIE